MPFIGNQPAESYSAFQKQDFTTSATTSYTLDNPVANANELALFINFVRQEPTAAYSASGTSLTLTSATSASDDMYCVYLGKAVQTVNPPNSSVGLSQLTATGTKDSTTFLRGDNTFAEPGGGLTMADQWRLTANITGTNADITANLEQVDTAGQGTLGSAMSVSSGVFTFPSTGIYLVLANPWFSNGTDNDAQSALTILVTTNNSSYSTVASAAAANKSGSAVNFTAPTSSLIDVTDTSNVKVKFATVSLAGTSSVFGSTSDVNYTHFTFLRPVSYTHLTLPTN